MPTSPNPDAVTGGHCAEGDTVGVAVRLGVLELVSDAEGVTLDVLVAVAPNDSDAVGVCVAVPLEVMDAVGVRVAVPDAVGVRDAV